MKTKKPSKEQQKSAHRKIHQLDSLVDLYKVIDETARSENYQVESTNNLREKYLNEILVLLEPILSKYILLFSGRLKSNQWTADTYAFLRTFSGLSFDKPNKYESLLHSIQHITRDYTLDDSVDSTEGYDKTTSYCPLYAKLIEFTIKIMNRYQVKMRPDGERTNFLGAYQNILRFEIINWLKSLYKDYFNSTNSVPIDWESDSNLVYNENIKGLNEFINSFDEFLLTDKEPWGDLTPIERYCAWYYFVDKMSCEAISNILAKDVKLIQEIVNTVAVYIRTKLNENESLVIRKSNKQKSVNSILEFY